MLTFLDSPVQVLAPSLRRWPSCSRQFACDQVPGTVEMPGTHALQNLPYRGLKATALETLTRGFVDRTSHVRAVHRRYAPRLLDSSHEAAMAISAASTSWYEMGEAVSAGWVPVWKVAMSSAVIRW